MTTSEQHSPRRATPASVRVRRALSTVLNLGLLFVTLVVVLVPILWLVQMSFRDQLAVFEMPPPLTSGWTFENYVKITQTPFFRHLFNSLVVSTLTTVFALLFGAPAAYAISRYRFRREVLLTFWILIARLALPIGFALPLFNIFSRLGLTNTYLGIVLAYLTFTVPLVIWILRPFLDNIPIDLEEAAVVDGATNMQVFTRIVLPLAAPGLVSVGILTFITSWIEFFYALIFTRGDMMTAPVSVVNFLRWEGWDWGQITAAGVIIMVPVILFSLFTHKYLISGLTAGAVKG